jgi:hypothetical protein
MSTTHGWPADTFLGEELSFTVAQPPASAVLVSASAPTAARMSALRMYDLLVRMPPLHRVSAAGSELRS